MPGRFGTTNCSYCQREFERVRQEQHLCCRPCHDEWFKLERQKALAAWRSLQRGGSFFVSPLQPRVIDDSDEDNQLRKVG